MRTIIIELNQQEDHAFAEIMKREKLIDPRVTKSAVIRKMILIEAEGCV
jgi:hypothetical protein